MCLTRYLFYVEDRFLLLLSREMRKRIQVLYLMILVSAVLYTLLWYGKINIKRAIYDQNGNVFRLLTVITETEDKQCGKNTTRQTLPQLQNTSDTQIYEETNQVKSRPLRSFSETNSDSFITFYIPHSM